MTLKELNQKKEELRKKIENAKPEELEEIRKEVETLKDVKVEEEKTEEMDERNLLKGAIEDLEKRNVNLSNAKVIEKPKKEERKMEEEKNILETAEYRSAFLKKLQGKKLNEVDINNQGMTDEEYSRAMKADKKPKKERTPEEQEALDKRQQLLKQRQTMISILRGMSIRIPLMIYGMDMEINDDVTIDNFTQIVDDVSWNEFMPKGVTKEKFNQFKKYK